MLIEWVYIIFLTYLKCDVFVFFFMVGTFHWLFLSICFHSQLIIFFISSAEKLTITQTFLQYNIFIKTLFCMFIELFSSWNKMQLMIPSGFHLFGRHSVDKPRNKPSCFSILTDAMEKCFLENNLHLWICPSLLWMQSIAPLM